MQVLSQNPSVLDVGLVTAGLKCLAACIESGLVPLAALNDLLSQFWCARLGGGQGAEGGGQPTSQPARKIDEQEGHGPFLNSNFESCLSRFFARVLVGGTQM